MHARVVLGVGNGVLFREVSSVQECPHREREVPLYIYVQYMCANIHGVCVTFKKPEFFASLIQFSQSLLVGQTHLLVLLRVLP